jgi:hypothetical protein
MPQERGRERIKRKQHRENLFGTVRTASVSALSLHGVGIECVQDNLPCTVDFLQHEDLAVKVNHLLAVFDDSGAPVMVRANQCHIPINNDRVIGKYRFKFRNLEQDVVSGDFLITCRIGIRPMCPTKNGASQHPI